MIYSHKREQTIELIRKSFIENYREKDINKISVKSICEKAGINRSTFYTYYTDVYELRDDVEDQIFENIKTSFIELVSELDEYDLDKITSKLIIKVLHVNNGVPLLLLERNSSAFISRIINMLKTDFPYMAQRLTNEDFIQIEIAIRYHFAGVLAVLKHSELSAEEYLKEYFEKILVLANEGPISIIKKYITQ